MESNGNLEASSSWKVTRLLLNNPEMRGEVGRQSQELEINENENRVSVERLLTGESAAQNDPIRDEEKSATVMEAAYRRICSTE